MGTRDKELISFPVENYWIEMQESQIGYIIRYVSSFLRLPLRSVKERRRGQYFDIPFQTKSGQSSKSSLP